jgi:hypothetical protein
MKRSHVSLPTILSDKPDVIEFLARYYPHFDVSRKILTNGIAAIMASACVMLGEDNAIRHGILLWKPALYFRSQINATMVIIKEKSFENLILKQKRETTCKIDIMDLESKSSLYLWKLQASRKRKNNRKKSVDGTWMFPKQLSCLRLVHDVLKKLENRQDVLKKELSIRLS